MEYNVFQNECYNINAYLAKLTTSMTMPYVQLWGGQTDFPVHQKTENENENENENEKVFGMQLSTFSGQWQINSCLAKTHNHPRN